MTTDFVDSDVALPATKVDVKPVTNATRQISAADVNAIFTGIDDIRDKIRGAFVSVASYGAVGDGTTDDYAAIQEAIDVAEATVSGGFGAMVLLPKGTFITSQQIVLPSGVGLMGAGPSMTTLKAKATFNGTALVTNELRTGTQEFAFLRDILISGNKGNGAVCSVAVVDWVSLFVNSYISNCIIEEGSNVGLRIAADGTPGGMGPIYVENCWVARNTGHNLYVEDTVANTGASTGIVFVNFTSENQGSNKSAIYLKGNGRLAGVKFIGTTHIEMGNPAFTGKTGITVDGCAHSGFENVQLLADAASVSFGIDILNVVQNVGLVFEHVYNPNVIATVLRDQKNSVTIGAVNINRYVTADWVERGAPNYLPASSSAKSIVFQSSAGTARAWFDGNGRLAGASANGAGIDIVGDATNDRPLSFINAALDKVYDWGFPSGGGGVLRLTYRTGGVSVMQIGTDGKIFHYEAPTFQKLVTLQGSILGPGTAGAAPSSGTHARGEVVLNADPSAGGKVGWVCTAAGTPGTWKAFGAIDP